MNCFSAAALIAFLAGPAAAEPIKFATLAPEGTHAMKIMADIDAELREKTGGELSFKFYPGGRQGDEKDMVRKIRLGQLHAGGFTGVGLGEVAPEARILDVPFLFQNAPEVDHIYKVFDKDLSQAFLDKGFVLLGWTEVGFVHLFSKYPVRSIADIAKLKMWVWEGDMIAEAAFRALGAHPIPLSITDVNTSLQTGLIDTVYASPLYAIALQWHEKTKHVCALPMADASGAVLLSKKFFDKLPKDRQDLLLSVSHKHLSKLNELTRQENEKAVATLKSQGLQFDEPSPQDAAAFQAAGARARREMAGRIYSLQLLNRVEKSLADFRQKHPGKKP